MNLIVIVTSLVEVRIEIREPLSAKVCISSLPLWKCGLKYPNYTVLQWSEYVTSLVEVRIEIIMVSSANKYIIVTSLVEVRIEIVSN